MSLPARSLSLETLRLEQEGRVLTAWYSSPPLNFATAAFTRDLDRLTRAVDRDDSVGAVVLTGGVEGRFLTHADPHELGGMMERPHPQLPIAALEPAIRVQNILLRAPLVARSVERLGGAAGKGLVWLYRWKRTFLRMNRSSTVYLAAMNGPTAGGGLETALGFDLRFLADADNIRVGQFETTVGLIPGGGGTQRLTHMLGTARALEHMLEGRLLSAAEALELGIVHRVIPAERLLDETQAVAARLARRSPVATSALKRSVYFASSRRLSRGLDFELAGFLAAGSARTVQRTLPMFLDDLQRLDDTPVLADPEPWVEGTKVDLTA